MTQDWQPGQPVRLETPRFVLTSLSRLKVVWHSYQWTSDPEVMSPFGMDAGGWTWRSWYRRHRKYNNRRRFCFGIQPKCESRLIGYELAEVSVHGVATLSVLIGDHDWWGKGVVQETRSAILEFLFEKVGCARVWGTPTARNFPSVFNYQKLGFTCEGTLRQHGYDPESKQRVDLLIFSMLRDEWVEKHKREGVT